MQLDIVRKLRSAQLWAEPGSPVFHLLVAMADDPSGVGNSRPHYEAALLLCREGTILRQMVEELKKEVDH